MRRDCEEGFPRHRLQRKPLVSDPGMHMLWCMLGSLTRGISFYFSQYPYLDSEVTLDMIFWNASKMHHLHLNVSSWQHIEGCIWNQLIGILWRICAQMNWGMIIGPGNALLPVRTNQLSEPTQNIGIFQGLSVLTFVLIVEWMWSDSYSFGYKYLFYLVHISWICDLVISWTLYPSGIWQKILVCKTSHAVVKLLWMISWLIVPLDMWI